MSTIATLTSGETGAQSLIDINNNYAALNTDKAEVTGQVFTGAISATNLSGTNTGDNAANTLYSGLVTNATHTGDATGSTALTLATVNSNVGSFTNATITVNAKGLITAAATGSTAGILWSEVTGTSQSAAVNNAYITNNAALVTVTLPTTAPVGSIVRVVGKGAGGWKVAQNAAEQIIWNQGGVDGVNETTVGTGGYLASTDDYDAVELVCITADTTWTVLSAKGNITLA